MVVRRERGVFSALAIVRLKKQHTASQVIWLLKAATPITRLDTLYANCSSSLSSNHGRLHDARFLPSVIVLT